MSKGLRIVVEMTGVVKQRSSGASRFELHVPRLAIPEGAFMALCGVSGSGKSTLLDMVAGALQPDRAEQFVFARRNGGSLNVLSLWDRRDSGGLARLRREELGYVLQTGGLLSFLTVLDNIMIGARLLGHGRNGVDAALFETLGIDHLLGRFPSTLSMGERQRVAIARAVAHRPALILADEPTASLDPVNAEAIFSLFLKLAGTYGIAVLVATHEWDRVEQLGLTALNHRFERHDGGVRSVFWN